MTWSHEEETIDTLVDMWHESTEPVTLRQFLRMDNDEYDSWVRFSVVPKHYLTRWGKVYK